MVLLFLSPLAYCQINKVPGGSRYNSTSGAYISTLTTKLVSTTGEVLWLSEPEKGIIVLINNDSLSYPLNIRLDIPEVEIHDDSVIKIIPMAIVQSIVIDSHQYVPNTYFKNVKLPRGFYEILVLDSYSLLGYLNYKLQAVTYNVQFDVGETTAKATKETRYYILSPTFGTLNLDNSKKKRIKTFFSDPLRTEKYLKEEKIRISRSADLKKWVAYENSIIH